MPFIFDMLYREYCRARLAEMRKQLLLWPGTPKIPEASSDIGPLDSAATTSETTRSTLLCSSASSASTPFEASITL